MTIKFDLFDQKCAELGAMTEPARADLIGVNRTTLWRWRNGKQIPSLEVARHVAKKLDVNLDELVSEAA